MPRVKREFDSRGVQAQQRTAEIAPEGPAAVNVDEIEVVTDGPNLGDKADRLAFMEDMLTISIQPSHEPLPEDPVQVGVNGRMVYIPRNRPVQVRRKYVERLARAKQDNISQDVTAKEPDVVNRLRISPTLRYPFIVHADPAGAKGMEWLNQLLQQAD